MSLALAPITHPEVEVLWNVWPFTIFFWTPVRLVLNFFFLFLDIPLFFMWYPWNLFAETNWGLLFGTVYFTVAQITFACVMLWWLILPIPIAILGVIFLVVSIPTFLAT